MAIGDILLFTVNSILPLILLIGLGYFLKLKGFFSKDFLKIANKTVFYVCLPVLLFKNVTDIDDLSEIRFDVILYVLVIIVILITLGFAASLFIKDPRQKGVVHQCIFRSNFALIGVPLAELIGGSDGVRVAAIISIFSIPIFNIMSVIVLSVYKEGKAKVDIKKILLGIVKNPLIIGVLLGLIVAVIKTSSWGEVIVKTVGGVTFLQTAITYLSRSATPLALLVLGGQFDFKKMSGYKKPLTIGLIGRNFIAPIIGLGGAAILVKAGKLNFEPCVFAALIALFGTPVAVASAVMAESMDNDGQLAGQLVVWTSLLSILSLFVFIAAARALGLV